MVYISFVVKGSLPKDLELMLVILTMFVVAALYSLIAEYVDNSK